MEKEKNKSSGTGRRSFAFHAGKDPLVRAATLTNYGGSSKTRINHLQEAKSFVKTLRELGYNVKKWSNVTNKHVGEVVREWQRQGLSTATLKENMAGVRATASRNGNEKIYKDNAHYNIENREYISNKNKEMDKMTYNKAIEKLKAGDERQQRLAAQIQVAKTLGLRHEEARKFRPSRDVLADGRVHIHAGTKGGRERMLNDISQEARQAIEYARSIVGKESMIPRQMKDKQWESYGYRELKKAIGTTKMHGLRHAYAQQRYQDLTGYKPRVQCSSLEEFKRQAKEKAGDNWQELDKQARGVLKAEMGHGPDRDNVISQYIGSNSK